MRALLSAALLVGLVAPTALGQRATSDALRRDIDFARSKVYPALVNIQVVTQAFREGRAERMSGAGSGVIVSPAGHVLTNFHVAGDTTRIVCAMTSGETLQADVVAHDPLTDLSVLKLRLGGRKNPNLPLPFATLGDSAALEVGDYVLAMGNPLTLSSSLTLGVVSNPRRVFTDFTGTELEEFDLGEGQKTGMFTRWIQHDALILPGNSGGPLVNLRGEVVGINELGGVGVGFAIPSNLAATVLNQVMTFGEVRRGWLGFSVLPVAKLDRQRGALVSYVVPGSPGEKAGLEAGDVLLRIGGPKGGLEVTVRFFEEVPVLYRHIAELPTGIPVELHIERGGAEKTLVAEVAPMEPFLGDEEPFRAIGITARNITGPMALARRYPIDKGVVVTGVRPGFPAEEASPKIQDEDLIHAFAGEPVHDLASLRALVEAHAEEEVVVAIMRDEESLLTVVKLRDEERAPGGGELPDAWLGIQTQVLTPAVAKALGVPGRHGYRISRVYPWTQAAEAGLQRGDLLVSLDGEPLDAFRPQDARDLVRAIEDMSIGDVVELGIIRGGEELTLPVELQETPATAVEVKRTEQEEFEFSVREVTFMDRIRHKWPREQEGVVVTEVTSGSWADVAGLKARDLIMRLGGEEVADLEGFEAAVAAVLERKPAVIPIFLRRGYRTHFIFIEPDWSKLAEGR